MSIYCECLYARRHTATDDMTTLVKMLVQGYTQANAVALMNAHAGHGSGGKTWGPSQVSMMAQTYSVVRSTYIYMSTPRMSVCPARHEDKCICICIIYYVC